MPPSNRKRAALDAADLELLRKHAPILRFDSMEMLRPCTVDAYVSASTVSQDGELIPVAGDGLDMLAAEGEFTWQLDPLGERRPEGTVACSAALLADYRAAQDPAMQGVCYGRVVKRSKWIFLQYWFFYVDNPCVLGFGRHDGDWESVQVRVSKRAPGRATHVTVSQHGGPETHPMPAGQERPVVYVAVDSHAAYVSAGDNPMLPLSDVCDGRQRPEGELVVLQMPVDGWPLWRGRWGVDRGPGTRVTHWLHLSRTPALLRLANRYLKAGDSPSSPGWQGNWPSPARTHASGLARKRRPLRSFAHWLGKHTWPKQAPRMELERVSQNVVSVVAHAQGRRSRRVRRVVLLLHEAATGMPVAQRSVDADGRKHTIEVPASDVPLAWRAAGYNWLRQRGEASLSQPLRDPVAPEGAADATAA